MEVRGLPDRVGLSDLRCDHFGFCLRLLQCRAVSQTAAYPMKVVVTAGGVVAEARGVLDVRQSFHLQLGRKEQLEARRQHLTAVVLLSSWPGNSRVLPNPGADPAASPLLIKALTALAELDDDKWTAPASILPGGLKAR